MRDSALGFHSETWVHKAQLPKHCQCPWQARKNVGIPCKFFTAWVGKQPASQLPFSFFLFFFFDGNSHLVFPSGKGPKRHEGKNRLFGGHHNLWASPSGSGIKNPPAKQETPVWSLGQEDPWRRAQQPTPVSLPGESHGQRSLADMVHGIAKSQTWLKPLSMLTCSSAQYLPRIIQKEDEVRHLGRMFFTHKTSYVPPN